MPSAREKASLKVRAMATSLDRLWNATTAWELATRTDCALRQRAKAKAIQGPRCARTAKARAITGMPAPARAVVDTPTRASTAKAQDNGKAKAQDNDKVKAERARAKAGARAKERECTV